VASIFGFYLWSLVYGTLLLCSLIWENNLWSAVIVIFFLFSVPDDNHLWSCEEERTVATVCNRTWNMSEVLWEMERTGSSGICGTSLVTHVPLSARAHQLLSETYAPEGFYFTLTKYVQLISVVSYSGWVSVLFWIQRDDITSLDDIISLYIYHCW
jgi:hypothetical protein